MQFTQGLHRAAQEKPNAIATYCDGRTRTFSQLIERVARLASGMRSLGMRKGDKVAILAFNSDYYLEYYLAVAWTGMVANPINFRWSEAEIVYSLNDSASVALFMDDAFAAQGENVRKSTPTLRHLIYAGAKDCPPGFVSMEQLIEQHAPIPDAQCGGDDLFAIFYTGGTTGSPKGVKLSHANLGISALGLMTEGAFPDGATGLHAAPMFHLADVAQMGCLLLRGGKHVFIAAFRPEAVLKLIEEQRVTDLLLVPAMIQMLVDCPSMAEYDAGSVTRLLYGAAPVSEALLDRAIAALPQTGFMQVYGMTESSAIISVLSTSAHRPEGRARGLTRSAGRAAAHVQLRVVNDQDVEVERGGIGEIVFRSPGMMQGYLNKPEATEGALRGGWMRTGDMGYMNEDGYLFIIDRLKDMIITGGENVYCAEVENAIARHPAVLAVAVIGIPSDTMGEAIHACVVLAPSSSLKLEDLVAHCKKTIAGYKCPRSLEFRESLPMSGAGKILKTELRKPFWKGRDRDVS